MSDKNKELYKAAETLREKNKGTKDLVLAIRIYIFDHAKGVSKPYRPKTIIESRFTLAHEAFEKGMLTCGTISTIAATMLKHLGFQVKFVHGESAESVDHAWISILEPETNSWVEYDLTRPAGDIPATHIKKKEVDSWEELKDQIYSDHKTMRVRRKERRMGREL